MRWQTPYSPWQRKALFPFPLLLSLHLLPWFVVAVVFVRPFRMSSLFSSVQCRSLTQWKPACLSFTGLPNSRAESSQGGSDKGHWGVWKRNTGVDSTPLWQWQKVIEDILHSLTHIWSHYSFHRQMMIQLQMKCTDLLYEAFFHSLIW